MNFARRILGKVILLAAIAAVAAGFFAAPLTSIGVLGRRVWAATGWDLRLWGTLIVGALALLLWAVGWWGMVRRLAALGEIILGVVGVAYVIFTISAGSATWVNRIPGGIVAWQPGAGFWIVLVGFVVFVVGGVLELLRAD